MGKARAFFSIFFLFFIFCIGSPVMAQEADEPDNGEEVPIESDWSGLISSRYTRGDQIFTVSAGVVMPMMFWGDSGILPNKVNPVGGTGFLAYNYFLGPHLFVGGEVGIMFIGTLAENTLFMVPFGLRFGYQLVVKRFEFPVSILFGGARQQYLEQIYFGLFVKPSASVFFRFNPDWSFGINATWWLVPQWPHESGKDTYGNFLELTLAARYHF